MQNILKYIYATFLYTNFILLAIFSNAYADSLADEEISLYFSNRPPYFIDRGTEINGITAERTKRVFKAANIPFKWQEIPSKRQLLDIKANEKLICAPGWFWRKERAEYARYTKDIYQDSPQGIIGIYENNNISKHQSLKSLTQDINLTALTNIGFSYGDFIDQLLTFAANTPMSVSAENIKMLKLIAYRRADYMFISPEEGNYLLAFSDIKLPVKLNIYTNFNDAPMGEKRYIICSKKVGVEIIEKLDKAIDTLVSN